MRGNACRRDRREFLRAAVRNGLLGGIAVFCGVVTVRARRAGEGASGEPWGGRAGAIARRKGVSQLDPEKCVQCGRCATNCVLAPSAVKCVHTYGICGYCKLCFGYFQPGAPALTEAAENQLCPAGAIRRGFVETPYYEYTIDESLCVGCGKCVKGCTTFGNGSLHLQVRHDRCLNCNECSIGRNCPADAYRRVAVESPYLLKSGG
jgi:electron transport complex protein RnfB